MIQLLEQVLADAHVHGDVRPVLELRLVQAAVAHSAQNELL